MQRTRFRPKRDEVTRGLRKLHNNILYNVYATKYNQEFQSKEKIGTCTSSKLVGNEKYIKILIGNLEVKRKIWRIRGKWE